MCYSEKQYKNRITKVRDLDAQIKELEKQRDSLVDDIKQDMGSSEKVIGSDFCISFTRVITNRFDTKSFRASHEELYHSFSVPVETRRFTYKMEV